MIRAGRRRRGPLEGSGFSGVLGAGAKVLRRRRSRSSMLRRAVGGGLRRTDPTQPAGCPPRGGGGPEGRHSPEMFTCPTPLLLSTGWQRRSRGDHYGHQTTAVACTPIPLLSPSRDCAMRGWTSVEEPPALTSGESSEVAAAHSHEQAVWPGPRPRSSAIKARASGRLLLEVGQNWE